MQRKVYVGKRMYAIFSNKNGKYVQPCTVIKITDDGFYANCHNGGEDGKGFGEEYFKNSDIGHGVYFSKDSAMVNL